MDCVASEREQGGDYIALIREPGESEGEREV